jgi:hypothetical protein
MLIKAASSSVSWHDAAAEVPTPAAADAAAAAAGAAPAHDNRHHAGMLSSYHSSD